MLHAPHIVRVNKQPLIIRRAAHDNTHIAITQEGAINGIVATGDGVWPDLYEACLHPDNSVVAVPEAPMVRGCLFRRSEFAIMV